MSSQDQIEGHAQPLHCAWGFVFLSFAVSFIGAFTTIELLHRRGNFKGLHKWRVDHGRASIRVSADNLIHRMQLLACSAAFGIVCVWCMAFVADSALVLGDGRPDEQLYYAPGFVVLSAMVPLVVSCAAFAVADFRFYGCKSHTISLLISGSVTGLAVVAMHYVASFGVSNYQQIYHPDFIGGAIIIACSACTAILFVVFRLQDKWLSPLRWRILCAFLLAAAVTGMHFEAANGTTYIKKAGEAPSHSQKNCTLWIALAICACTIVSNAALFAYSHRQRRKMAGRAQQVVLACARFDHEGRLMVTREGALPCRKITTQDNDRAFDDDFNNSHEAFQWIFRVSSDWESIMPWLKGIREHLGSTSDGSARNSISSDASSLPKVRNAQEDYSVFFRESFCLAAANLADDLREPIYELGNLFDAVMTSGSRETFRLARSPGLGLRLLRRKTAHADVEHSSACLDVFGKGQVLYLLKRTERKDVPKFQSMGYRFLPVDKIVPILAEIMQVPQAYLHDHLSKARASALNMDAYKKQPTGVFLSCFAVKPGVHKRSWDVLVNKQQIHKLPSVPLWSLQKMAVRKPFIDALDGKNVSECLAHLEQRLVSLNSEEEAFAKAFKRAIVALKDHLSEPFFPRATLSSVLAKAPLRDASGVRSFCSILAFHVVANIHDCTVRNTEQFTYINLSFFKCRQQTIDRAASDPVFREKVYQEFARRYPDVVSSEDFVRPGSVRYHDDNWSVSRRTSSWRNSGRWPSTPGFSIRSLTSSMASANMSPFPNNAKYVAHVGSFSASTGSLAFSGAPTDSTLSPPPERPDSATISDEKNGGSQVALVRSRDDVSTHAAADSQQTFVDEFFAIATARWTRR